MAASFLSAVMLDGGVASELATVEGGGVELVVVVVGAFRLFCTRVTPLTPFAICSAFCMWAGLSTAPLRVTTPLLESTLICVPLTNSSASNAAFTFVVNAALSTALAAVLVACFTSED